MKNQKNSLMNPYTQPKLTVYGNIRKLTQASSTPSGSTNESGKIPPSSGDNPEKKTG